MRKDFGAKPITYPQPVLILATYNEDGTPNAMNAAWGGVTGEKELTICCSAGHKTTENLLQRKALTVSMATAETTAACDYVGLVSGKKVPDKFRQAGFHAEKALHVDAPLIRELPVGLECTVRSYDPETARLVVEIVSVTADESVLDEKGSIDIAKLRPITFDPMNHVYLELGAKTGDAFRCGAALK